jgi:integrase
MRLTQAVAKRLATTGGREIAFDDALPGFGLRRGSRWIYQYSIGTKQRRFTIGRFPALDAAKARELAADLHARVRLGEDPQAAKDTARAQAEETFEACLRKYLPWQKRQVRASTYGENERHLLRNLAPLHGLRIDTVDRRSIAAQLTRLTIDVGSRQANATRASLAKFLDWCLREGLAESNQALLTNKNAENRRERVLSNSELTEIWRALPNNDFGTIVKILILTGQRKSEIADLSWHEIDFDRGAINLPARRVKNGRDHTVPLSSPVTAMLKAQPHRLGRDLVFGSGNGGFSGWSKLKLALDETVLATREKARKGQQKQRARTGTAQPMPAWTIHDLRRSAATGMAELGVQPHIVEAILNHVSGHRAGVAGIYNKAVYESEKRAALALWADHVLALVEGRSSNVTSLKRARL